MATRWMVPVMGLVLACGSAAAAPGGEACEGACQGERGARAAQAEGREGIRQGQRAMRRTMRQRGERNPIEHMNKIFGDGELALSEEQSTQIQSIIETHKSEMEAFMAAHELTIETLRVAAGLPERPERPEGLEEMDQEQRRELMRERLAQHRERAQNRQEPTEEQAKAREALRELMEQRPSRDDVRAQVESVLTESQVARLEEAKAEMEARRAQMRERMQQRRGQVRGGEGVDREGARPQRRRRVDGEIDA